MEMLQAACQYHPGLSPFRSAIYPGNLFGQRFLHELLERAALSCSRSFRPAEKRLRNFQGCLHTDQWPIFMGVVKTARSRIRLFAREVGWNHSIARTKDH